MDKQPVPASFLRGPNCSPDPYGAGTQAPLDIFRFVQNSRNEKTLDGWCFSFYFPTLTHLCLRKFWELLEARARCSLPWGYCSLLPASSVVYLHRLLLGFPGPASAPALILRPTLELSPAFPGLGSRSLSRAQQEQHPWSMYKKLSLLCVPSALPYG